jgi:hypothetical protein
MSPSRRRGTHLWTQDRAGRPPDDEVQALTRKRPDARAAPAGDRHRMQPVVADTAALRPGRPVPPRARPVGAALRAPGMRKTRVGSVAGHWLGVTTTRRSSPSLAAIRSSPRPIACPRTGKTCSRTPGSGRPYCRLQPSLAEPSSAGHRSGIDREGTSTGVSRRVAANSAGGR